MQNSNTVDFLGYSLFVGDISALKSELSQAPFGCVVNTINPHSYVVAKEDPVFRAALECSDYLVPDGAGIVVGVRVRHRLKIQRIAGFDVFNILMTRASEKGLKVFFLGAADQTLVEIKKRCSDQFPGATVVTFSPPYKQVFSDEDNSEMIRKVNDFKPDILFVGMTAPKQEKWLAAHKSSLSFGVASCIGAVFDFYAGNVQRPSPFWQKIGLEWLPRLVSEPKRLWRRTFISAPKYLWDVFTK